MESSSNFYENLCFLARDVVIDVISEVYGRVIDLLPAGEKVRLTLLQNYINIGAVKKKIDQNWIQYHTDPASEIHQRISKIMQNSQVTHISCFFANLVMLCQAMLRFGVVVAQVNEMSDTSKEEFRPVITRLFNEQIKNFVEKQKETLKCDEKCKVYEYKAGESFIDTFFPPPKADSK